MAENDKSTCTDVVVKDGKCQYHYDRAVKQQQQPRGSRRSSSVAGPSVPASSTSSDRIGPHGPVAPLPQASTSESHNAINPRSPLHPPPRPPTSIDPNTIIPRSVVGPLPQPSSSTISNLDNINNPPLRSATYPGSLIPPVVPTAVMPPPPAVTPLPQPSLYWLETVPSNPIIKGNIIPISSSYLLMPDSAPMSPEGLDTLNKNVQRLKRLIQACHGRTIEQATAGWAWCMSRLVDESPCLALHQESPIDVVPADRAPNPALTSSFLHCWQRYCKTWGLRLLVQCTSTRRQEEVMWERRQVVHEDEVVFHNHKAMLHPPALRSVDDPSDELADMEGYRYVSTPGALWDMPVSTSSATARHQRPEPILTCGFTGRHAEVTAIDLGSTRLLRLGRHGDLARHPLFRAQLDPPTRCQGENGQKDDETTHADRLVILS